MARVSHHTHPGFLPKSCAAKHEEARAPRTISRLRKWKYLYSFIQRICKERGEFKKTSRISGLVFSGTREELNFQTIRLAEQYILGTQRKLSTKTELTAKF